jgi:hypothetical protein
LHGEPGNAGRFGGGGNGSCCGGGGGALAGAIFNDSGTVIVRNSYNRSDRNGRDQSDLEPCCCRTPQHRLLLAESSGWRRLLLAVWL